MSKLAVTFKIKGTAYIIPDNEKHLAIKQVENLSVISEGWK